MPTPATQQTYQTHQTVPTVFTVADGRHHGLTAKQMRQARFAAPLHGIRVATPARTWRDLAGRLDAEELVVLGDSMTRRKGPTTSLGSLRRVTRESPAGTRGIARMRLALELIRPRTDSSMETRTRLALVGVGERCPEVNHLVRDERGHVVALVDMAYVPERVAIEYDGDVHRTDPATWRRDVARKQALEDLGWRVVVVTADDVLHNPHVLIQRVRKALRR
ncbi:endonuclease domain-containing protein [Cellulomonas sp. PhB143]|uniref:endonuclease domain-containing protein n=1 Tax=Cellulomonas sp. PhB143 TaxID=2485186 RepID=UPI000F4ACC1B|nr:DUF559 domain-containing protein [Cellulomonas sp. PhB143]ROS78659.1 uncharacterized protein DUF559 [Cellulomonas sp. PhB143]